MFEMTEIRAHSSKNTEEDVQTSTDDRHTVINSIMSGIVAHYSKDQTEQESPVERVVFEDITDSDNISSGVKEKKLPPACDGCWGLIVVIAAFLVYTCIEGLAITFGPLYVEFISLFKCTKASATLVGSLFMDIPLLVGPISGALVNRYGCRATTMVAGVFATISFLLASKSNSIGMMGFTFGFMSGLAIGIFYVTAAFSVVLWFDKRRNFAISLASSGVSFGAFVFLPMTQYFLEIYDLRDTIVLLAGTLLNMCVCGALMRHPAWFEIKKRKERKLYTKAKDNKPVYVNGVELKSLLKSGETPENILSMLTMAKQKEIGLETESNVETNRKIHSVIDIPTFVQQNEKVPLQVIEKMKQNKLFYNVAVQNYIEFITKPPSETNRNIKTLNDMYKGPQHSGASQSKRHNEIENSESKSDVSDDPIEVLNIYDEQFEEWVPNFIMEQSEEAIDLPSQRAFGLKEMSTDDKNPKDIKLQRITMTSRPETIIVNSEPNIHRIFPRYSIASLNSQSSSIRNAYRRFWDEIKTVFDFRMVLEFHFLIFLVSCLFFFTWYIIPYFFLWSYMSSLEIDDSLLIINIIEMAVTIGMVPFGLAGDKPWINETKAFTTCLIICGLCLAAYPFCISTYWALMVVSIIFGFSLSSHFTYIPSIILKLVPIDHFSVAYGFVLLTQGVGHMVGSVLAGMLYDMKKELPFYIGGIGLIVSGLCMTIIIFTKNFRIYGNAPLLKDEAESKLTRCN